MFGLGFTEILLILAIALIVFGPERLPEIAQTLGRTVGMLRRTLDELKHDFTVAGLEQEFRREAEGLKSALDQSPVPDTNPGRSPTAEDSNSNTNATNPTSSNLKTDER